MTQPPRIVRIPILPLRMVNAHLVIGRRGCIVVDAGLPSSVPVFQRVLAQHGLTYRDIRLIVVTHAHVDHAGGAAALHERSGAKVVAHEAELPYLGGRTPLTFCPTRPFARWFLRMGPPRMPYPSCRADIEIAGQALDLTPYGVDGCVLPTPGHTAGSLSVQLDSGDALVGDLVASGIGFGGILRCGVACRPVFEDDPARVRAALTHLLGTGSLRFHLGHGGPLPAREVQRHAQQLHEVATRSASHA